MQVVVSGKHLDIGDSLRKHTETKVSDNIKKYFEQAIHAHVTIAKNQDKFHTDIIVNEGTGTGVIIKGSADDLDPYRSVDNAIGKMEYQLRRYKGRIKHHRRNKEDKKGLALRKYVIAPEENPQEDIDGYAPTIIAEHQLHVELMSVSEAVMRMDLENLQAYLFINNHNNHLSMVYYRKDGNIAWVDSGFNINMQKP